MTSLAPELTLTCRIRWFAVVFSVIGLVLLYRVTRPDMGYYRWSLKTPKGIAIVAADLFAVSLSLYVGWVRIGDLLP